MKAKGSETCPACRRSMFPGDIVCRACERRVKAVRPDLLSKYAKRDLHQPDYDISVQAMRSDILVCAIHNVPQVGRPRRMAA